MFRPNWLKRSFIGCSLSADIAKSFAVVRETHYIPALAGMARWHKIEHYGEQVKDCTRIDMADADKVRNLRHARTVS